MVDGVKSGRVYPAQHVPEPVPARKEVDIVWVVFDKDSSDENETKIKRFEDAFTIAEKENFKVAYSNEVFELWLLLH
ncbi:MAG TPA: RloB family protein, partial [Methanoregulaceae archaeon]|nr:RloB family protein [Methanoregulaceae archaeon]